MSRVTVGAGDEATWGPCTGHPNDPRTEDSNVVMVEGREYDLDDLTGDQIADLLEAGRKACAEAGVDFGLVLDMAVDHIRGALK